MIYYYNHQKLFRKFQKLLFITGNRRQNPAGLPDPLPDRYIFIPRICPLVKLKFRLLIVKNSDN